MVAFHGVKVATTEQSHFGVPPFGAGLRPVHYADWNNQEHLPILEVMADDHLFVQGGPSLHHMRHIAEKTTVVLHGIGMNIANAFMLNETYCQELKRLCDSLSPLVVSDHLCFTATPSHHSHDLLPFPYTKETLSLLTERVDRVQTILQRQFCLENLSAYVSFQNSEYSELEFLNELCQRTGCGVLLDVNNVFVSSQNQNTDPFREIEKIDPKHVQQFHIAGHSTFADFLFDTHDKPISPSVWELLHAAVKRIGPRPVIVERDDDACTFAELLAEIEFGNRMVWT